MRKDLIICLFLALSWFGFCTKNNENTTESFTLLKPLKVHFIPYWHQNLNGTFLGSDYYHSNHHKFSSSEKPCEFCIFDFLIHGLHSNWTRKFTIPEIGVFKTWWDHNPEDRPAYKILFRRNQIEFVNGGRTIIDESTTTFDQIVRTGTYLCIVLNARVPSYMFFACKFKLLNRY